MLKRDLLATKLAYKDGVFLDAKKRSYVGSNLHPGTDHLCWYLKGVDASLQRDRVFERDKGKCQVCGAYYGIEWGECHHLKGGLGKQRCWCMENLAWSCPKCHRSKHVRPMWTPRKLTVS